MALTAHNLGDTPEERQRLGVDGILTNPISPRALIAAMENRPLAVPAPPETDTLAGLRSDLGDLGAEATAEIVAEYLAQSGRMLAELQDAAARGDRETLARQNARTTRCADWYDQLQAQSTEQNSRI